MADPKKKAASKNSAPIISEMSDEEAKELANDKEFVQEMKAGLESLVTQRDRFNKSIQTDNA